jgi:hypothetical protein
MKRQIFIGLFIFSVILNVAVGSTLIWYRWLETSVPISSSKSGSQLSASDVREIKTVWGSNGPGDLWKKRQQILDKKAELLDLIARNPNNETAIQKKLNELTNLRAHVEKDALDKVRHIVSTLPEAKKEAFINYLRNRACMGHGMGMGPGMGMGMGRGRGHHGMMMRGPSNCPRWKK